MLVYPSEKQLITLVAKAWNNLDTRYIEDILSDNFEYTSQWVFTPLKGKKAYLDYLKGKFETIKKAMCKEVMQVTAELATHPSTGKRPIIILTQITEEVVRQCTLLIRVNQHKITHMDLCFIPNPWQATIHGEPPK